jgi:hypothetical protein
MGFPLRAEENRRMEAKTKTIKYAALLLAGSVLMAVGLSPAAFAQAPAPSSARDRATQV